MVLYDSAFCRLGLKVALNEHQLLFVVNGLDHDFATMLCAGRGVNDAKYLRGHVGRHPLHQALDCFQVLRAAAFDEFDDGGVPSRLVADVGLPKSRNYHWDVFVQHDACDQAGQGF